MIDLFIILDNTRERTRLFPWLQVTELGVSTWLGKRDFSNSFPWIIYNKFCLHLLQSIRGNSGSDYTHFRGTVRNHNSFTFGAYSHGAFCGVTGNTSQHPELVQLINAVASTTSPTGNVVNGYGKFQPPGTTTQGPPQSSRNEQYPDCPRPISWRRALATTTTSTRTTKGAPPDARWQLSDRTCGGCEQEASDFQSSDNSCYASMEWIPHWNFGSHYKNGS